VAVSGGLTDSNTTTARDGSVIMDRPGPVRTRSLRGLDALNSY